MARLTLILDSTQIRNYMTCPRLWYHESFERLSATAGVPEHITMGTLGHHFLEVYYKQIALGKSVKDAFEMSHATLIPDDYPLPKDKQNQVRDRFTDYMMYHCHRDFVPVSREKDPKIHKYENGSPTCTICGNHILDGKSCSSNLPLVEQGFSYSLLDTPEYLFVLEGRVDLLARLDNQLSLVDHKWQLRERSLYSKSIQFRNYALALNVNFMIVNYIRLHKKVEKNTFVRQPIWFSAYELQQWKIRLIEIFKEIAHDMDRGRFEKRESSCEGKFGYPCQFTPLCEEYNPGTIEAMKKTNFYKIQEWKPW